MAARRSLQAAVLRLALGARQLADDDRGSVLVMMAAGLAALVGMAALTLDAGRFLEMRRQLQNAADAAAHAGAQELPDQALAQQVAQEYWQRNRPQIGAPEIEISFPQGAPPRIRIVTSAEIGLVFGGALGLAPASLQSSATAELDEEPLPYALMALDPTDCGAVSVAGSASVRILDGGSYVRSSCEPNALEARGQARLEGELHDVVGGAWAEGPAAISPWPATGARRRDDGYAALLPPPVPGNCYQGPHELSSGTHLLLPDVRYCERLLIRGDASVVLQPGVFVLDAGLEIDGQASLTSNGGEVLLYNTCPSSPCNGSRPADVRFAGGGASDLRGHGAYGHMVLWIDRTAGSVPAPPLIELAGQAAQGLDGVVYAPSGTVSITGKASADLVLNVAVVADRIALGGNGVVRIQYDAETAPRGIVVRLIE